MQLNKRIQSKVIIAYIFSIIIILIWYYMVSCPFRYMFGIPCPGCGLTRAWISFFHGHIEDAFRWHPLFLVIPIFALILIVKKGTVFKSKSKNSVFLVSFVLLMIGTYIIRMYYMFPNMRPMTYNSGAILNKIAIWGRGLL